MEKRVINHFCHEHPLILTKQVSDEKILDCYGCRNPVTNLESAYVCNQLHCHSSSSRIILHEICGELPPQIFSHPSHPQHPLHLYEYQYLRQNFCNLCGKYFFSELGYRCPSCEFDMHIGCIGEMGVLLKEKRQLQHRSHVHPLTLMRKPAFSFTCDGCGIQDVDKAYICSTCEYWLHETCALLPYILPKDRHRHRHHRLSLAFCFPMEHRKYRFKCDVCFKDFGMTCWLYFCGDCRYFVHLNCVASTTDRDILSIDKINDGSDMIQFPLLNISKELITPFVMREKGFDSIPAEANDMPCNSYLFNYHKHPLSLVPDYKKENDDEENEAPDSDSDDEESLKICNVCVTPISSPPYYECIVCRYFVHSICYMLPKKLSSSSPNSPHLYGDCSYTQNKNHEFSLHTSSGEWDAIRYWNICSLCNLYTNGMMYVCEGCNTRIDVKCASLPTTIRHASHPHHKLNKTRLAEKRDKWRTCYGCGKYHDHPSVVYLCSSEGCDFGLDLKCALLPPIVDTGDKHPLLLTYDASVYHPGDFYCQVCEQEMHPKGWMYYCCECDTSFHTECLEAASGQYRNFKFGRRFALDGIHPHPLTFNYVTLKKRCDVCRRANVNIYPGLECASCYYVVCWGCGRKELNKISLS